MIVGHINDALGVDAIALIEVLINLDRKLC